LFDVGKCPRFSLVGDPAEPGVALAVSRLPLSCRGKGWNRSSERVGCLAP
jgi:hypothetical protein